MLGLIGVVSPKPIEAYEFSAVSVTHIILLQCAQEEDPEDEDPKDDEEEEEEEDPRAP